jgi:hypothetical protein
MKTTLFSLCMSMALLTASPLRLQAQSCFTYTDNYGVYTDVSTDGTNIYTSVLIDGSGQMNLTGGQGCSSINYGNAVHTPIAVNVISNGSSYVGGMQSGTPECPDCYLSYTNYQSVPATEPISYTFSWHGEVDCNFGGSIFGSGGVVFDYWR